MGWGGGGDRVGGFNWKRHFDVLHDKLGMALPVSSKYGESVLDTDKSATNACKIASKRMIQKTAVARVDLFGNKIAEKTTKAATKDNHDED